MNKIRQGEFERITTKVNENIYRMVIPYKDIWTTVYAIKTPQGALLFDAASYDDDAEQYIVPFLASCGITEENLKYIFISHNHKDHAGGLVKLMEIYPKAVILSRSTDIKNNFAEYDVIAPQENDLILDTFKVISVVGHTADAAGLLDMRTKTFITGDSLQIWGIVGSEPWAANIRFPVEYFEDIQKIQRMDISEIYAAHDYYPCGHKAQGKAEVDRYLDGCKQPLLKMKQLILENPDMDDQGICDVYNKTEGIPTVRANVIKYLRAAVEKGRF